MEIIGKIKRIYPIEQGINKAGKNWQKLLFVLQTKGQYPLDAAISLFNDKATEFSFKVGDSVKAQIDINSHEFNGRWYTEVTAWKVDELKEETKEETKVEIGVPQEADRTANTGELPF